MTVEAPRPSLVKSYRPGLRSVVGASATAYGYTLTVGPTSMLLTGGNGPPEPLEVLLFSGGAILAFARMGALAFGDMTERLDTSVAGCAMEAGAMGALSKLLSMPETVDAIKRLTDAGRSEV
jgi:hypothetical protein